MQSIRLAPAYMSLFPHSRSPTTIPKRRKSASGWASTPSASADILCPTIMMLISAKNSIPHVKNVPANDFSLYLLVPRRQACIGWSEERTLMSQHGVLLASNRFITQDVSTIANNIVPLTLSDVKNAHAPILPLTLHVSLVMAHGRLIKFSMKWKKIGKCLERKLGRTIFPSQLIPIFRRKVSIKKNIL